MTSIESFENYAKAKVFTFTWEAPLHLTEIIFNLPDFSQNPAKVWGDWGPMYEVNLKAQSPIRLSYTNLYTNEVEEYALEQKTINLHSPMHVDVRKQFPFFINFIDERKDFLFHLYLNKDSEIKKIEIKRAADQVTLHETEI